MSTSLTDRPATQPPPEPRSGRTLPGTNVRTAMFAMVVLTLMSSAVNYGSSLVFSRVMTPASFGDLTALLALAVVLAVPTGAAQTVVAARVAQHAAEGRQDRIRYLVRHALAHVMLIASVVTFIYILCIPLVDSVLDLQALGAAISLAPLVFLAFMVPLVLGVLQGLDRFVAFGVMSLASALSRPAFGVPWAEAGGGAGGAIGGQAIGGFIVLIAALWILRNLWATRGTGAAKAGLKRQPNVPAVLASGAFVAFAVISNLDVVLAKVFLEPAEAGVYAALATIGKVLIFLPGAIAVVLVPSAARARKDARARQKALRIAALAVIGTTAVVAIPALAAPEFVIRLMFGEEYISAAPGVMPMVIAGTGLALLYLLVVYSVTIEDRRWVFLLVLGVALQVVGIGFFHESPTEVAAVQAVVVAVVLLLNEARFHSLLRPRKHPVGDV